MPEKSWFEPDAPGEKAEVRPLGERLAWFIGLAALGLLATAGAAYVLRALLFI